jgi:hypothetical protein
MIPSTALLAPPGKYLDASSIVNDIAIKAVKAAKYLGIARYVPLPGVSAAEDISEAELDRILGADLLSWPVQHSRYSGWDPADHDGEADARVACAHAKAAGYPPGVHMALDLEGIWGSGLSTIVFAKGWQHVVLEEGFRAMLYVGYGVPLHPLDLYSLPGFDQYWSDAGNRDVDVRGCSIHQKQSLSLAGVKFDADIVAPDRLGALPYVASAVITQVA